MSALDFSDFRFFPVVIVASGASLTDEQCQMVVARRAANACRVIVVNDNYRKVPNADILYAADFKWWKSHCQDRAIDGKPGITKVAPHMIRYSCEPAAVRPYNTHVLRLVPGRGIAPAGPQREVRRGSGGGFQATGMAIAFGARKVVLIGMDCKRSKDGKAHWFGDHHPDINHMQPFPTWADEFDSLAGDAAALGIDIVNCTIDSAIRKLRRSTLERELWPAQSEQTSTHTSSSMRSVS